MLHKLREFDYLLTTILLSASLIIFWNLGQGTLDDWDEAIYAQISKEIINTGNWLTLHWGDTPWFHKPPLFMWSTAIAYKIFGIHEWSARLVSALSGIGVVLCTYLMGKTAYSTTVGFYSAIIILFSQQFIRFSRFGTTDITLCLFTTLILLSLIKIQKNDRRFWLLLWLSYGLAFMTKGIASLPILGVVTFAAVYSKKIRSTLKCKQFWMGVIIFSVISIPWHFIMIAQYGREFIDTYLGYHVAVRAMSAIEGHQKPIAFYLSVLQNGFFPWFYLIPLATIFKASELLRGRREAIYPFLFTALTFSLYTIAQTKLPWYILPIYPCLALLVGMTVDNLVKNDNPILIGGFLVYSTLISLFFPSRILPLPDRLKAIFSLLLLFTLVFIVLANFEPLKNLRKKTLIILFMAVSLLAGFREIRTTYNIPLQPEAKLAKSAGMNPVFSEQELLVFKLSESIYVPATRFYSNRPIRWILDLEGLNPIFNEARDAILAKKDIELISGKYSVEFEILDEQDDFLYVHILPE